MKENPVNEEVVIASPLKRFTILQTEEEKSMIDRYLGVAPGDLYCALCGSEDLIVEVVIRARALTGPGGVVEAILEGEEIMAIKPIKCSTCESEEFVEVE
jgi:hypothetical protein